jgi:hypothetical protein
MLKYSPTTDDGRSCVGYLYIFISDLNNFPPPHSSLVRLIYIDESILRSIYREE